MVIALCDILNTILWLFNIDAWWLSYIGGVSFLTILFLYVSSYVFQFCEYHRMFIHYVMFNNIVSTIDYYTKIEVGAIVYLMIIGVFLFLILYFHQKETKNSRHENL